MKIEDLKNKIINILEEKKAISVVDICVKDQSSIADYFIVASGNSDRHVRSLSENLEDELSKLGIEPERVEGYRGSSWILMDYGDIIVNIFLKEARDEYSLEKLWIKN